jgi:hypothetical protein
MKNKEKYTELCNLLNRLPSIGQTIGTLNQCMRRCRRTDSPKYIKYDEARVKLLNEQADIISAIKFELVFAEFPNDPRTNP